MYIFRKSSYGMESPADPEFTAPWDVLWHFISTAKNGLAAL